METVVVLPKLGNSVETSIIVRWLKQPGDPVAVGDVLCEVETDKATVEVPSTAAGTLLTQLGAEGAELAVLAPLAVIGGGEQRGSVALEPARTPVSPRARKLAAQLNVDAAQLRGTGPGGRIIERDVRAAASGGPRLTPAARNRVASGDFSAPARGSGPGGRVSSGDLLPRQPESPSPQRNEEMKATKGNRPLALLPLSEPEASGAPASASERPPTPLSRTRQVIARRMRESLQSTAQLTLSASADATALLAYRQRLKQRSGALGLPPVSLNDLVMFAVSRTLPRHGALNATFDGAAVTQHAAVHLGFAVDTPRGLLVPTIFDAQALSLAALAREAARLALACRDATVTPDELGGATFTVSNLGALGVESFTPILNPPQVAILGVGALTLRPVERAGAVTFAQHLGLSLTVDHQVVDGAPAARFLHALGAALAEVDLLTVGS